MTDIDVSKIPVDVMKRAEKAYWATTMPSFTQDPWVHIAVAIMHEREECAELASKIHGSWGDVPAGYMGTAVYAPATGTDIAAAIRSRP